MEDMRIRYFMDTTYDADGNTIARVMERPKPYTKAVCIETFSHEWRAEERIKALRYEAKKRGERVVYQRGESLDSWSIS